jgi:hypothetical protein
LKAHVEAYEAAARAAHRAVLIMCGTALALLGLARTPKLVVDKLSSVSGLEVAAPGDRLPVPSYAVVLGLVAIPVLVHWCHRRLTRALRLRREVEPLVAGLPDVDAVAERLAPPLLGSPAARRTSWVVRAEARLAAAAVALIPVIAAGMMLWDYSHKFSFGEHLARFNGPFALWVTAAGNDVVRPEAFDSITSQYHPALLPWWQPWVYLGLLVWAVVLLVDGGLRLGGRGDGLGPVTAVWRRPALFGIR